MYSERAIQEDCLPRSGSRSARFSSLEISFANTEGSSTIYIRLTSMRREHLECVSERLSVK